MAIETTPKVNTNDLYSQFASKPVNQQQVKLSETKPDTVELSTKKKVATTGIGAIIGGVIGGIGKFLFKKSDYGDSTMNYMVQNEANSQKEKILGQFYDEIAPVFKKASTGEALSENEKQFMDNLGYNHPMLKFLSENERERFYELPDKKGFLSEFSCNPQEGFIAYNGGPRILAGSFYTDVANRILDSINGNQKYNNNQEYFDLLGEEFKNKLSISLAEAKPKALAQPKVAAWLPRVNMWLTENGIIAQCIQEDGTEIKGMSKAFTGLPGGYGSLYKELTKKYGAELENIEAMAKDVVNKNINNECLKPALKSAGIGAAIVGGVALAGTLIYSHIKNKDNNKA